MSIMRAVGKSKRRFGGGRNAASRKGSRAEARWHSSWTQASADAGSDCQGSGDDVAREAAGSHALEHSDDGQAAGLSHTSVKRIWHAHGLKPHLMRGFKLSNDKRFVEKVKDVVGPVPLPAGQSP
jgi:hypothetical protein